MPPVQPWAGRAGVRRHAGPGTPTAQPMLPRSRQPVTILGPSSENGDTYVGRWERLRGHVVAFVELYIAAASAAFASVLTVTNVLGVTNTQVALVLMPWTLGLLALALVRDRFTERATAQSVEALKDTVDHNTAAVRSLTHNAIFATQDEPYRRLIDHINHHGAREVMFVQFSGSYSLEVMTAAMKRNASIELFLEHEDTAGRIGSQKQTERIVQSKQQHLSARHKDYPGAALKVYKAFAPMSVRAIKIDETVLCVGWYTFEEIDRQGDSYAADKVTISGHDRPTVIAWSGTAEFDVLNDMVMKMIAVYRRTATPVDL